MINGTYVTVHDYAEAVKAMCVQLKEQHSKVIACQDKAEINKWEEKLTDIQVDLRNTLNAMPKTYKTSHPDIQIILKAMSIVARMVRECERVRKKL